MDIKFRRKIRAAYAKVMPDLVRGKWPCPYSIGIDWYDKFSPIEENVWASIRYFCLPFYPQFPVGPYFIDFAEPHRKIAIEVDSVKWHQDKEKDKKRQTEIESWGWKFLRLPSRLTYKIKQDFYFIDDDGREQLDWNKYITESAEGIIREKLLDFYHG